MDSAGISSTATNTAVVGADDIPGKATVGQTRSFTEKPLSFMQEWLAVRRKGQDFMHTPMGYVCQGRQLRVSHPFFAGRKAIGADADDEGCAVSDLGGTTRIGHGGIADGSVDEDSGDESDGSVEVDEDEEVRFGDKDIDGYIEDGPDNDVDMGEVESVISRAHSVMDAMSEASEGRRGGV